jgi:hypothetical protein
MFKFTDILTGTQTTQSNMKELEGNCHWQWHRKDLGSFARHSIPRWDGPLLQTHADSANCTYLGIVTLICVMLLFRNRLSSRVAVLKKSSAGWTRNTDVRFKSCTAVREVTEYLPMQCTQAGTA